MSEIVQVSLRGTRREFFLNSRSLWLRLRDRVVVQGEHGESLGTVLLKDPALIALKKPGNVTREMAIQAAGIECECEVLECTGGNRSGVRAHAEPAQAAHGAVAVVREPVGREARRADDTGHVERAVVPAEDEEARLAEGGPHRRGG